MITSRLDHKPIKRVAKLYYFDDLSLTDVHETNERSKDIIYIVTTYQPVKIQSMGTYSKCYVTIQLT